MMHRSAVVVLAAGLAALAVSPGARGYCRTTTGAGQPDPTVCETDGVPIAWAGGCANISIDPVGVPADIALGDFRTAVTTAASTWSDAACGGATHPSFHLVPYADCAHGAEWNPQGKNTNSVSFPATWPNDAFHSPDSLAITITTFTTTTGEIRDADTELNALSDTNPNGFAFTTGVPSSTQTDLPTVILHELGHAHGLAHSPLTSAVMWYTAGFGEQRRALTADDAAGVCVIYPPGRSASCNPDPRGGFSCATGCQCAAPGAHPPAGRGGGALVMTLAACALCVARRRQRVAR